MDTLSVKEQLLDRVAKLVAMGTAQKQIAQACGLTESRISQLVDTDEFRARLAELQSEDLEQADLMNRGWDSVEELALGNVLEAMQANPDPQFALQVANSANRAQRRGGIGNAPINGKSGATAVIQLNLQFTERLQEIGKFGQRAIEAESKRVDALPIAEAEHVLRDDLEIDLAKIFKVEVE